MAFAMISSRRYASPRKAKRSSTLLCGVLLLGMALGPARAETYAVAHSFDPSPGGASPQGALVRAGDGTLYGTTFSGGSKGVGILFSIKAGVKQTLYSFTSADPNPSPGLTLGADGNLYGTTGSYPNNSNGTIFEFVISTKRLTTLHTFTNGNDGSHPNGGLIEAGGTFYGSANDGGANGSGALFSFVPNGASTTLTTLYSFTGGADGSYPISSLVRDSSGNLYGTTASGGSGRRGTLFQFVPSSGALNSLHGFTGKSDGSHANSLALDAAGDLYGTAASGGTDDDGVIWEVPNATGSTPGAFATVYTFTGADDGSSPNGGIILGADGDFYGTTTYGGSNGKGVIFQFVPATSALNTLASFDGQNGSNPGTPLVQGADNNFYGATASGTDNDGVVFEYNTTTNALTTAYAFPSGKDGSEVNRLILGTDGNFYGTTYKGGTSNLGTVFQVQPGGTVTTLHSFAGGADDGDTPAAGVIQGKDGYLYGTTEYGGADGNGTVFKISTSGAFTLLYSFSATGSDGSNPDGTHPLVALLQDRSSSPKNVILYGATSQGGSTAGMSIFGGSGTIFKITGAGVLTTLYTFSAEAQTSPYTNTDGATPEGSLFQGSDNNLYGTAYYGGASGEGTLFSLHTDGTGFTNLHSFTNMSDGSRPHSALIQTPNGTLYGTANFGGTNGDGVVYNIQTNGTGFTTVYTFSGASDGTQPQGDLLLGADGNLYGTTYKGGASGFGTIYELTTGGMLTSLYQFTGGTDGGNPYSGVVVGKDGNFYGGTNGGGQYNSGVVYRLGSLPVIFSFTPTSGSVGTTVTISGANFTGVSAVEFNGVSATFTVVNSSKITATVPAGATTGKISVKTSAGTAISNVNFTVH